MKVKLGTWSGSIWVRCWVGAPAGVDAATCRTQTAVSAHTNRSISHPAQLLLFHQLRRPWLIAAGHTQCLNLLNSADLPSTRCLRPRHTHTHPSRTTSTAPINTDIPNSTVTSKHAVTLKFSSDLRENTQRPGLRVGDATLCRCVASK